jgi:4-hydroxy-4-methyl-2-oxoglutarate aldolase
MNRTEEILRFIQRNRVSTTEVTDALGKAGELRGIFPLTQDQHKVGKVRCVFASFNSNYAVHEQIRDVEEGEIVIVFAHECDGRAILGDLIAKFIIMYRGAEALVVNGAVRDAARLRRERYPIWAKEITPLGCFNTPTEPFPQLKAEELRRNYEGGIAVCDDGGVVVIPPNQVNDELLEKLQRIELQEDVWYYCLNTLKWDTKRIVCDKEYLTNTEILPDAYKEKLAQLSQALDKK